MVHGRALIPLTLIAAIGAGDAAVDASADVAAGPAISVAGAGPQRGNASSFVLRPGVAYRIVVTGTGRSAIGESRREVDAAYCFQTDTGRCGGEIPFPTTDNLGFGIQVGSETPPVEGMNDFAGSGFRYPAFDASHRYEFTYTAIVAGRLYVKAWPRELNNGSVYSNTFSVQVLRRTPAWGSRLQFKVDGFPDQPAEKYFPSALVGVDLQTDTVLEFEGKPVARKAGDVTAATAEGTISMTTSYLLPGTPVQEKHIELRVEKRAAYFADGVPYAGRIYVGRGAVVDARVTNTDDSSCDLGAKVRFLMLVGKTGSSVTRALVAGPTPGRNLKWCVQLRQGPAGTPFTAWKERRFLSGTVTRPKLG